MRTKDLVDSVLMYAATEDNEVDNIQQAIDELKSMQQNRELPQILIKKSLNLLFKQLRQVKKSKK